MAGRGDCGGHGHGVPAEPVEHGYRPSMDSAITLTLDGTS